MLKIRQEQVEALVQARWDNFYERAQGDVRRDLPDQTRHMSDNRLRGLFFSAKARSHKFGLRTEAQIVRMFFCSVLLGDRFEERQEYSWAKEVLQSRRLGPNERALLLQEAAQKLTSVEVA
jgi:hypothetical protein